jgi:predicted MPP superfamily phosphohydrolase
MYKISDRPILPELLSGRALVLHFVALCGIVCFAYGYFIEPYKPVVETVKVYTEKFVQGKLKIVQISDLHCEGKVRSERKVVELVNSLKPDVIVFTGDALNAPEGLPLFRFVMRSLNAAIGKYAVLGNYDVWYWQGLDLFANTGFQVLNGTYVQLTKEGETFFISGVNYGYTGSVRELLKHIPGDRFHIFLCHTPDLIEEVKDTYVDLYLAGHTHGGQVVLPLYGALITFSNYGKEYESGWHKVRNATLYVNRGIGMEGGSVPRVRFLSSPEITVFEIKPRMLQE